MGKVKQLLKKAEGAKKAYILIYANPDPDALASAWALKELLEGAGISATIGYTGQVGRPENEAMITSLRMPVLPFDVDKLNQSDFVALVDCQPDFFKDIALPRVDAIIDHHPQKAEYAGAFSDIRTACLATASVVTEYLLERKISLNKRLATALYYGIQTDSRGQHRAPTSVDRTAIAKLEKKIDRTLLRRIEFSHYSSNDLHYFEIALAKRRYAHNVLYAHLGHVPSSDACVQVADFFIRVKEAHWALVTGVVGEMLIIVFRCDGLQKNAGKLAHMTFGELGSAGGHTTMGRAEISLDVLPKEVKPFRHLDVERFVIGELAKANRAFKPLYRSLDKK